MRREDIIAVARFYFIFLSTAEPQKDPQCGPTNIISSLVSAAVEAEDSEAVAENERGE